MKKMSHPATADRPSIFKGMGPAPLRVPEQRGALELPAGTVLVSADNHWSIGEDIFYRDFPAHLKARAPRLWTTPQGGLVFAVDGQPLVPPHTYPMFENMDQVAGCSILEAREKDLDIEGIDKEIVFGNVIAALYTYPDLELREWIFRIYNQHLAEMQARAPGRFYGVGLINYWEPEKTRASLDEVKRLGLKTVLIPQTPRAANFEPINYREPEMWPFWEAVEEAGLPICFHVGESIQDGPGGCALSILTNLGPFRKNFGELIFGGILDRHPGIRAVFVEGDINWLPGALQHCDMIYEAYAHMMDPKIRHHPRHYWQTNLYATFMTDPAGLRLIDEIGADRVMWSNDYPHQESVFGCSWKSVQQVLDAVPAADAVKILGGNAIELFDLN
jgi:predicted TIM-barrel fold metal-dependent hydrolase